MANVNPSPYLTPEGEKVVLNTVKQALINKKLEPENKDLGIRLTALGTLAMDLGITEEKITAIMTTLPHRVWNTQDT